MALADLLREWLKTPEGKQVLLDAVRESETERKRLEEAQRIKPEHLTQLYR